MAVEKKNETLGIRMCESMLLAVKAIADADGVTVSELVLTQVSRLIEDRRSYWSRLDPIFRDASIDFNDIRVDQGHTDLSRDHSRGGNIK